MLAVVFWALARLASSRRDEETSRPPTGRFRREGEGAQAPERRGVQVR
jgi:hypothetical protein